MLAVSLFAPWYLRPVGRETVLRYGNISAWHAFAAIDVVLLVAATAVLLGTLAPRPQAQAMLILSSALSTMSCLLILWRWASPAGPSGLYDTGPGLVLGLLGALAMLAGTVTQALSARVDTDGARPTGAPLTGE